MSASCKTCKYSHQSSEIELECRYNPPTALVEEVIPLQRGFDDHKVQIVTSRFVQVNNNDWCGKYEDRHV